MRVFRPLIGETGNFHGIRRTIQRSGAWRYGAIMALDARTIAGVENNGLVDSWASVIGSIVATGSGATRPAFLSSGINGRPGISLNGVDQVMSLGAGGLAIANNIPSITIIAVVQPVISGDTTHSCVHLSLNASGGSSRVGLRTRTSAGPAAARASARRLQADAETQSVSVTAPAGAYIASAIIDFVGNSVVSGVNGVRGGSTAMPGSPGNSDAFNSSVAWIGAAGTSGTANRYTGVVSSVLIAVPALDAATEIALIRNIAFQFNISI